MSRVVSESIDSADEFESVRDELSDATSAGWSGHGAALDRRATKHDESPGDQEVSSQYIEYDEIDAGKHVQTRVEAGGSERAAKVPQIDAAQAEPQSSDSPAHSATLPQSGLPAGLTSPDSAALRYLTEIDKFIIRDLDAGRAYIATASPDASCHKGEVKQKLKDLATGAVQQFQYNTVGSDSSDTSTQSASAQTANTTAPDGGNVECPIEKTSGKAWLRGVFRKPAKSRAGGVSGASGPSSARSGDSGDERLPAIVTDAASDASSSPSGSMHSVQQGDRASPESLASSLGSVCQRQNAPGAMRMYAHKKVFREFTDVRHVQTLAGHEGAVWVLSFSEDGTFMASGGDDRTIRIWQNTRAANGERGEGTGASLSSRLHAGSYGCLSEAGSSLRDVSSASGTSNIFCPAPVKLFVGHSKAVLDISWSGQFVLSSSADKSVCMWHLSRDGPLKTFRHDSYVFAAVFHPLNGRHFVSACIDGKVRMWRAADPPAVLDWKQTQSHSITCAAFSAPGDKVLVGTQTGRFRVYSVSRNFKLEYQAEVDVRERRKRRREVQVSGIRCSAQRPDSVLVTSKDSRIRLYDGFRLAVKYKGLKNQQCKIAASFSPDGLYVICGSDSGSVYIWRTETEASACLERPLVRKSSQAVESRVKNSSYEVFRAFPAESKCTVAAFAPVVAEPVSSRERDALSQQHMGAVSQKSSVVLKEIMKQSQADTSDAALQAASELAYTNACKLQAYGRVIVSAGFNGEIRVYDNVGFPAWM